MDVSVGVVTVLFTLSLFAAWILFKFLQSTASITKKEYQMGGAAAGFLIIYGALYYSYSELAKSALDDSKHQLAGCQAALKTSQDNDKEVALKGVVDPALKDAQIVYATRILPLPDDGTFRFSARLSDLKSDNPPAIYIIDEQEHNYLQLDQDEDFGNIKITLPKKGAQ
jgi:hypothetical protein